MAGFKLGVFDREAHLIGPQESGCSTIGRSQKAVWILAQALGILLPAAQILEQLWQKKIYYCEKYPELFFQLKKELRIFSSNSKFAPAPKSAEGPVLWLCSMYLG